MKTFDKHIVLITPGFPAFQSDDQCIPALQFFAKELCGKPKIKVSVISVHYPANLEAYSWHNCQVYPLGINNNKRKRISSYVKQWKTLSKIHNMEKIDCIHSFWLGECAFIGRHFSKKYNIKHLCTLMGQDALKNNFFARLLPLKEMNLVSLSPFHQVKLKKNHNVDSTIIPWGINISSVIPSKEKTIDIIGIGSLIPLKRYTEFIATIALIKDKIPSVKAILIGEGIEKNVLIKQIKKQDLVENIEVKGALPYSATQSLLSQAKILLHTSEYESYGMVFAEALAHQIPIVSREVGIAKASISWVIGNSASDFSKACIKFMALPQLYQNTPPDIKNTLTKYLELYNR